MISWIFRNELLLTQRAIRIKYVLVVNLLVVLLLLMMGCVLEFDFYKNTKLEYDGCNPAIYQSFKDHGRAWFVIVSCICVSWGAILCAVKTITRFQFEVFIFFSCTNVGTVLGLAIVALLLSHSVQSY